MVWKLFVDWYLKNYEKLPLSVMNRWNMLPDVSINLLTQQGKNTITGVSLKEALSSENAARSVL